MDTEEIKSLIEAAMPEAVVNIEGDGEHFSAVIVSNEFEGKGLVEQHQLVYSALGDNMKAKIHAISIKTFTQEEWEATK